MRKTNPTAAQLPPPPKPGYYIGVPFNLWGEYKALHDIRVVAVRYEGFGLLVTVEKEQKSDG